MKTLRITIIIILSTVALCTFAQNKHNNTTSTAPNVQKKDSVLVKTKTVKTVTTVTTTTRTTVPTPKTIKKVKPEVPDSGEVQVRNGLKDFGKGVEKIAKREWKTLGKTTKKIGMSGKQFVQKLGKTISNSFQKDSTDTKKRE